MFSLTAPCWSNAAKILAYSSALGLLMAFIAVFSSVNSVPSIIFRITYYDARRIKVIVKCFTLTQKFRRKEQVEFLAFQFRIVKELLCIFYIE